MTLAQAYTNSYIHKILIAFYEATKDLTGELDEENQDQQLAKSTIATFQNYRKSLARKQPRIMKSESIYTQIIEQQKSEQP